MASSAARPRRTQDDKRGTEESAELCQGRRSVGPVPPSPVNRKTTPTASNVYLSHVAPARRKHWYRFLDFTVWHGGMPMTTPTATRSSTFGQNISPKFILRLVFTASHFKDFYIIEHLRLSSQILLDVTNRKYYLRPSIKRQVFE